ncbi:MAG: hypothetical protein KGJ05_06775 [Alphaproteobacteria bacterium]|nr:hypothetical protein [Alphaproteobacteria bacterium]MDE2339454.1 hypothetical protein [Alphaproteobacteria bacterium]
MRISFLLAVLIAALSTSAYAKPETDPVPPATPIGKPVSCIPLNQVMSTEVQSDKVIDFHMIGGKIYRNTLPYSCPNLGFEQRFEHTSWTNDYCAVDTITVLEYPPLMQGATCGLGDFQQVVPIKTPQGLRHNSP